MKKIYIYIVFAFVGSFYSCDEEFLEVVPKGIILPENVADYEAILNSPTLIQTVPINLIDFTDDVVNSIDVVNQSSKANGYFWRPILNTNEKVNPDVWGPLYRSIYNTNVIINGVVDANNGTVEEKNSILAEALVTRANIYLDLLTVFAKAYDPATAASDYGLPMPTSTDVTDKAPERLSLEETLNAMIVDVKEAIDMLPLTNINRYRVTKYAAYGLLSRIYLYMHDFTNAEIYTNLALEAPYTLLDYNDIAASGEEPNYDLNPEVLWQRQGVDGAGPTFMIYSDDLNSYFDDTDLRYELLTVVNNDGLGRSSFPGRYNFGSTFPEMLLTKAELLARAGNYLDAMDIVNELRSHRIKTADYVDQVANSGPEALELVLNERRRELAFSGLRWFDMKRLDQEGRMPAVTRINPDTMEVEATLAPGSSNYTFQIPIRVQKFNPDMPLN
ncbi:RagB/SusD family nutrient uptake outer membrane protein [Flavobacteriaceae bacterium F08102]|nr:RagB/SusD family nutrient uptake outer membrane protein [Flavobacteriaceae bacterium F08102]